MINNCDFNFQIGSGSGPSSDLDQHSSRSENGVSSTSINYRKVLIPFEIEFRTYIYLQQQKLNVSNISMKQLYEEVLKENQLLKARLSKSEEDIADLRLKVERVSLVRWFF